MLIFVDKIYWQEEFLFLYYNYNKITIKEENMIKMILKTNNADFKLEFDNFEDSLKFLESYIIWDEGRMKPAYFDISMKEYCDDNKNL